MSDILVIPPELRQIAEQLNSHAQQVNQALRNVDSEIKTLRNTSFLGCRAETLQAHYNTERDALLRASRMVIYFAEELQIAATRFETADKNQNVSYIATKRDQLRHRMQSRYDELVAYGEQIGQHLTPDTTGVFDSEESIGTVLLNPANRLVIEQAAKKYDIHPALLMGIIAVEMDLDYEIKDRFQDGLGRRGLLVGNGPGVANVHTDTLRTAIQYLQENNLPGANSAVKYEWSATNRSSFNGSTEAAAIVAAMYSHVHGGASSSEDMAVIWGAYKTGIKDFIPNDPNYGYDSVESFRNHIARGAEGYDAKFQIGRNSYYVQPYFEYFREALSSPNVAE